jgi:DNA-binding response OmpR family regulator
MKILIAEDEPISRLFLEKTLQRLGYEVTACKDGNQAWEAYLATDYRIVISDWMMPGTDGLELCQRIRQQNRPTYCYFMMLTMRSSKADFLQAMDAGADDYLTKPLDADEVEVRLRVAERILAFQKMGGMVPEIPKLVKPINAA